MKKINWKSRVKNPVFWINTIISLIFPILTYYNLSYQDFSNWTDIFIIILNALKNPYIVGLILISIWNNITNPTTTKVLE